MFKVVNCTATTPSLFVSTWASNTLVAPPPRYAFLREMEDGRWSVVLVKHRGPKEEKTGEVYDFNVFMAREDADGWVRERIGESRTVYTDPDFIVSPPSGSKGEAR